MKPSFLADFAEMLPTMIFVLASFKSGVGLSLFQKNISTIDTMKHARTQSYPRDRARLSTWCEWMHHTVLKWDQLNIKIYIVDSEVIL